MDLVCRPIEIHDGAWVAAECFVGPGVTIGEGAVASARSCVFKDVEAWKVVRGNPAAVVAERQIQPSNSAQDKAQAS